MSRLKAKVSCLRAAETAAENSENLQFFQILTSCLVSGVYLTFRSLCVSVSLISGLEFEAVFVFLTRTNCSIQGQLPLIRKITLGVDGC